MVAWAEAVALRGVALAVVGTTVEAGAALGAAVVLVVLLAALFGRHRGSKEAQSMAGYRRTLDVLGRLGDSPAGAAPAGAAPSAPGRRDRALATIGRTPRRLGVPVAVAVVVLAAAGASAYLVARGRTGSAAGRASKTRTTGHHHSRLSPQVTTGPTRYLAVQSTSASATYAPATASYSLVIGATSGDCWFNVTTSSGATVLAQTFAAGASATLSLTGTSTVDIGAPTAATLSIGKAPLVLPQGVVGPFTVTIAPK